MKAPKELESLLNNTLKTFNNTFSILNTGTGMAASGAADISGGAAFAYDGKNLQNFL